MQFDEALRYLLSLGHETLAIKLGLRNIELLLAHVKNPQLSFPAVQIAGTNGKGSTAVVLDSICRAAGIKTGLYTSPHLVSITERIRISGEEISPATFARQATLVRDAAEQLVAAGQFEAPPTFFEQVTAIALLEFRDQQVDLAILETGLGGRLDATTAARAQTVAITQIAFDHQNYLGDTLASISAEKAAIIRPGVTAIIGKQTPEALEVILQRCKAMDVDPNIEDCTYQVDEMGRDGQMLVSFATKVRRYSRVRVGLRGLHQLENIGVAIGIAESLSQGGLPISEKAIIAGIENAKHAGRLEYWPGHPAFLFDGAHNVAGASALRAYLESFESRPLTLVFGAMADKNLEQMAAILFPIARRLVLVQIANPRAATIETMHRLTRLASESTPVFSAPSPAAAIDIAQNETPDGELICVTGSLYLVGDIQAALRQPKVQTRGN